MLHKFLFHKFGLGLVVAGLLLTPLTSVLAQSEVVNAEPAVATDADTGSNHIFLPLVQGGVADKVADEIRASGTVITGTQQIDAFFNKDDHNLYMNYGVNAPGQWQNLGTPTGTTIVGNPEIITYIPPGGTQHIDAFVRANNGHLYENSGDGVSWGGWNDRGIPLPSTTLSVTVAGDPAGVVLYEDTPSQTKEYVFVRGSDNQLYQAYGNGVNWSWVPRYTPSSSVTLTGNPAVSTIKVGSTIDTYVFVTGSDGHLYSWWDNGTGYGLWTDHTPTGATVAGNPGVTTYKVGTKQHIDVFVIGSNGHLYVNSMVDSPVNNWTWADLGAPLRWGLPISSTPEAITYLEGSRLRRYVFVRGSDGHLYLNSWDSGNWVWADRGTPTGATLAGDPGVTTYKMLLLPRRIYAFVKGNNGHLYENSGDGVSGTWTDRGTP